MTTALQNRLSPEEWGVIGQALWLRADDLQKRIAENEALLARTMNAEMLRRTEERLSSYKAEKVAIDALKPKVISMEVAADRRSVRA